MEDFNYNTSRGYYSKGFGAGRNMYGKNNSQIISSSSKATLPPKSEKYLYKFIELSKKEGFSLIFTLAPHDYKSTASMNNWHKEPQRLFNKVAEIAKENGIPFVNFNDLFEETGFVFKQDMNNAGHTNVWGSHKVTAYFGQFLKENYTLADHRNDEFYASWDSDYALYLEKEKAIAVSEEKDDAN